MFMVVLWFKGDICFVHVCRKRFVREALLLQGLCKMSGLSLI